MGCLKCYFQKDIINNISQFPQFMNVAINFVISMQFHGEVSIRSCRFHVADCAPGTHVNFICVAHRTLNHEVLACKGDNSVKSWVSNE